MTMYPVVLEGSRLRLREYEPNDLDAMVAYANDPRVMRWITGGRTFDRESEKAFLDDMLRSARDADRTDYSLAAAVKETREVIGGGRILIESPEHHRGFIGYVLRHDQWGYGYGTEIAMLLVQFGFQTLRLHRIAAYCDPDNRASVRILEKVGMQLEGRLQHHMLTEEGWRDSLLFAVTAGEGFTRFRSPF